ncbi:MAG: Maf family protein [Chloroflexota bacterium]
MSEWNLILASQSPRRRELLSLLGLPFEVTAADANEIPRADETPSELVSRLSRAKALGAELAGRHRALVIACDTIVAMEEGPRETEILGKPRDPDDARAMLRRLRGRPHLVYSAATVWDSIRGAATDVVETRLRMRSYSEAEIRAYVASGDPLDKAGAYAIQHQGFDPVATVEGCYASVMGLPLCHVALRLRQRGVAAPADVPAVCQTHTGHRCDVYRQIWTPA